MSEIMQEKENIRIVGESLVLKQEVMLKKGYEEINKKGKVEMKKIEEEIIKINREIKEEIKWVMRVEGNKDKVKMEGKGRLRENWEIQQESEKEVVKFMIEKGVKEKRIVEEGFGE